MKLLGLDSIKGQSWHDYANDLLLRYRHSNNTAAINCKPLWRSMYEEYCRLDKSFSPNVVFMQLLKTLQNRIDSDFPGQEISKSALLSYLINEVEKAMRCE